MDTGLEVRVQGAGFRCFVLVAKQLLIDDFILRNPGPLRWGDGVLGESVPSSLRRRKHGAHPRHEVSGFRVCLRGCGCRAEGAGCRVQGAGCRVWGAGCRVPVVHERMRD